jgi:hypothetical protein
MRVLVAMLAVMALVGCGESVVVKEWDEGEAWDQWARGVEAKFPVGDAEGHGPDVGSEEWARALQWKLGTVESESHGPDLGSAEWRAAVEEKIGGLGE